MKNQSIKMCDAVIHPGEMANLALPLPEQYSCAPLYMPIKVINGLKKGPCLLIFSVLKGNELNGLEIANRINTSMLPSEISGTIISVPVLNVYGLTHYPSPLPSGGNLANCFPGNENGTYGERIAHLFTHEILRKADYCIELQTGGLNHNILPQVYCQFSNQFAKQLAKAFKAPVVTNVTIEGNPLRQTTEDLNIPLLVYQAGEAMRFDENAITLGVEGIKNVMRSIEMLPQKPSYEITPTFSQDEDWIIAHKGGILHSNIELGQTIKKHETLGVITDPFGADVIEPIKSSQEGIVVGINTSPLVHEGLPVFKIASFLDYERAGSAIGAWDKRQPESYISS
jgi:hypothetical protein